MPHYSLRSGLSIDIPAEEWDKLAEYSYIKSLINNSLTGQEDWQNATKCQTKVKYFFSDR